MERREKMTGWIARYARWLHTRWPAGTVERLPELTEEGATRLSGVYVAGDLTGVPLLKFALDSGARAVEHMARDLPRRTSSGPDDPLDLVILGAGVAGMAAAVEARHRALTFRVVESSEPFSTLVNFPKAKPIYTYPKDWIPEGRLQVAADVKEDLIEELRRQVAALEIGVMVARAERVSRDGGMLAVDLENGTRLRAFRVLVAIGRSGDVRKLGVPGENLDKVFNRLHDPQDFEGRRVLVVGGGDTAAETAIALVGAGADVTLCHRGSELARPKPANRDQIQRLLADPSARVSVEHPTDERTTATGGFVMRPRSLGRLKLCLGTRVREIRPSEVSLQGEDGPVESLANDVVFVMIGREAPLAFFRRSGLGLAGEMTPFRWAGLAAFVGFCAWLYNWKSGGSMSSLWERHGWFPFDLPARLASLGGGLAAAAADPRTLLGTLAISAAAPAFWYTLAYSILIVTFGYRRIRRRKTPYVTAQTLTLMAIQVVPLFLLPELVLPLLGHNGHLPVGIADALFPVVDYGHGREYWRAYGFILAWPLDVYNVFTHRPLWAWIAIGFVQTAILIPIAVYFFGKGAYCGWICSCGALAETLGDTHRHKMPHGPLWNRLNLAGQAVLGCAVLFLVIRITGWILPPGNWADRWFDPLFKEPYKWVIDVFLAGVIGYGLYFWYSGRVWCRFFCPLAALMHIYARFSRFRILAEKKKCISCNVCTSVCHQGIDVMNFANKGIPMADPECVRCSACVESCPTGVLEFGQVDRRGVVLSTDRLVASLVRAREERRAAPTAVSAPD
jgi:NosR/NirI family nitrous oxide reductase transcriptional regulator